MDGIIQTTSASQAPRKDLAVNPLAEGTDADRVADVSRGVVGESVVGELGDTGLGRVGASMNFRSPRWRSIFARMRREDLCELVKEVAAVSKFSPIVAAHQAASKMMEGKAADDRLAQNIRLTRSAIVQDGLNFRPKTEADIERPARQHAPKTVTITPTLTGHKPCWEISTGTSSEHTYCATLADATAVAEHLLTPPIVMRAKAKKR